MSRGENDEFEDERVERDLLEEVLEKEYSTHRDQFLGSQPAPERVKQIEAALIEAYERVILIPPGTVHLFR